MLIQRSVITSTTEKKSEKYNRFKKSGENDFSIEGHRGCRGLMPENTIHAFINALKLGAHTLEMDVVVSGDGQIIVSNEPWMSSETCLNPDGSHLEELKDGNIYKMTYEEIKQYDCGRKINPRFPLQKSVSAVKPLLSEVINRIEKYILWNSFRAVHYKIDIKTSPHWDRVFQPEPTIVVQKVYELLCLKNIQRRCSIQSFDVRALQAIKKIAPQLSTALLVDNNCSIDENLGMLGFDPETYSPFYRMVDSAMIELVHQRGMKIIPWTVNDILDMNALKKMGVDGLITDFPDVAVKLIE